LVVVVVRVAVVMQKAFMRKITVEPILHVVVFGLSMVETLVKPGPVFVIFGSGSLESQEFACDIKRECRKSIRRDVQLLRNLIIIIIVERSWILDSWGLGKLFKTNNLTFIEYSTVISYPHYKTTKIFIAPAQEPKIRTVTRES